MSHHGLGLGKVIHQYVPSEDADEHVEIALEQFWIPRSHHAVIGQSQTPHHRKYQPLMGDNFALLRQCKPISNQIFYNQIKEGG